MKAATTFLAFLLLSLAGFSQFAFVSDKDGYVNVRSNAGFGNNIIDTLRNGRLVYCNEKEGSWIYINYSKKNKDLDGYVYHDRLKKITSFEKLPLITKQTGSVTHGKGTIKVTVTETKFDKAKYRITYHKEAKNQVQLINGKPYWGTDGGMPATEYKSIVVQNGSKTITLPAAALENLFEPSIQNTQVHYDRSNDVLYVQSSNSDGAGYYEVIWRVEKGVYKDRFVVAPY